MKKFNYSFLITLLFFNTFAKACTLQEISKKLTLSKYSARFVQTKNIKILTKPLISYGYILYDNKKGLIWQLDKPIKRTSVFTQHDFIIYNKNDDKLTNANIIDHKSMMQFSNIFSSIFSGGITSRKSIFSASVQCDNNQWHLFLKPNSKQLQKIITLVDILWSGYLQQMIIHDSNGDSTKIIFQNGLSLSRINYLRSYFEK